MNRAIELKSAAGTVSDCESVILVPLMALSEAGYIKTFTVKDSSHAKHEYHAMAQMAYFQFQDDELETEEIEGPLRLCCKGEEIVVDDGIILCRDKDGKFQVLALGAPDRKKLLETAYRYCTRWIRLDI